jgi:hypothetical protein
MNKTEAHNLESNCGKLVPFDEWLRSIKKGRVTGWSWRKSGTVKAINIFGRLYITRSEIARFEARAASGEFVGRQVRVAPARRKRKEKPVGFIDRLIGRRSKNA